MPDPPGALTSDSGWDTVKNEAFLKDVIQQLHAANIRVSLFMDTENKFIEGAKKVEADRIEFYTGKYAHDFLSDKQKAVADHTACAKFATELGLGINAGHDLNLDKLKCYKDNVPGLLEVSIGHALISDALYFGLKNTIQMYLRQLR